MHARAWDDPSSGTASVADLPHTEDDLSSLQSFENRYRHSDICAIGGSIRTTVVSGNIISEVEAKQSKNCSPNNALFRFAGFSQGNGIRAGSDIASWTHGYYDASASMERGRNFGHRIL